MFLCHTATLFFTNSCKLSFQEKQLPKYLKFLQFFLSHVVPDSWMPDIRFFYEIDYPAMRPDCPAE